MKVISVKYKVILREPGKDEHIVWSGTKKECEKKRLELSFTYNSEWLVVEEEEKPIKEVNLTLSGIFRFIAAAGMTYLCLYYGKKIYITD